jgi:non-homologous end joining protein Ku
MRKSMPRSLWTGTISFGLVSVPVRMFSATASKELRFHFLDRRDMSPIGYDKINKSTGKHVDPDDVIRAFEVAKGRFVELGEEDIDRLDVELTHAIDICEFVSIDEIDPIFFRKGYRNELRALLTKKAEGKELPEPSSEPMGEVVDLMEALRESVQATKAKDRARSTRKASTRKAAARKKPARKAS